MQIDNDSEISCFEQEEENHEKIQSLLRNEPFVVQLQHKMKNEGFYNGYYLPIIKLSIRLINAGINKNQAQVPTQ